jgi:hypothetical protein
MGQAGKIGQVSTVSGLAWAFGPVLLEPADIIQNSSMGRPKRKLKIIRLFLIVIFFSFDCFK